MKERAIPHYLYYIIAFVEGSSVIAVEILGAKILTPFFGSTLYIWTSVIGLTLLGLALGYFTGGYLIDKYPSSKILFANIFVAAILVGLMPFIGIWIMQIMVAFVDIRAGAVVSCLFFLLPPLFCLGMVSPMLIRLSSKNISDVGKTSGRIYAVSTTGGIVMTFLLGFLLIPAFGIKIPVLFTMLLLAIVSLEFYVFSGNYVMTFFVMVMGIFFYSVLTEKKEKELNPNPQALKVVSDSDGLLGKITVVDRIAMDGNIPYEQRILMMNWIGEANYDRGAKRSVWSFIHKMATISAVKPIGSKVLVLGLGGGMLANELVKLGFQVDGCELDERIGRIAKKYFDLSPSVKVFIDDARHLVRTAKKKYDVILVNIYFGETTPNHIITQEGLREIKEILNPDGLLIFNHECFLYGNRGASWRSVYLTMKNAGLNIGMSVSQGPSSYDVMFIASPTMYFGGEFNVQRQNICCQVAGIPLSIALFSVAETNFREDKILTDDKPVLDLLNIDASEKWRKDWFINNFYKKIGEQEIPFF